MAERWTRERRLEHTRGLLLEAAEEVFAEKGFAAATLDDIAHAAGYTKGAIYKHFATKEELFLGVNDRYMQRYFDTFTEVLAAASSVGTEELDRVGELWRRLGADRGTDHAALGMEFTLYLLRNPEVRARVAVRREETVEALGQFIIENLDRLGATSLIPPLTMARVLIHTTPSVVLGTELDSVDLYGPILEMYMSAIKLP
ncbi:TetR/AcrR family transcriptional regulator [Nocardia salmonicida]|uniref:TetR/AcrR family transcriptional regulator n=1 Tax=Nocardia salmonicida TaxID=53431 RepID=UPI002E2CD27F|nr:TetR family transcriptional regulator [Nocardia salmonicida]